MPDPRWDRTWELFHDALDREPLSRTAFLDSACAGDAAMRAEVAALLVAHDSDPGFLAHTPSEDAGALDRALAGRRIGPYLIRRVLGEGGMGIVCEAEQDGEVHRRVALKLVRPGMETGEVVARFADERQALALMNHPNIATAYDVGVTDDGRPFFAMEFVDGRPITEWCDARRMTLSERLELFLCVCDAVQHAHQKGIIHRDLKPSNVLVEMRDGKPVPKVIDFGVAKVLDRRSAGAAFRTHAGQVIGTPEYMSPEQAGVLAQDVDTRADIYSLGVLLFELLVGALPVDLSALKGERLSEIERLLHADDAPRPSQRLSALGAAADRAAANRNTRAASLVRDLRGDLDWIVVKAMEKDRTRRYATASELAADVSRYLADEPVLAGAPTTAYRVRKFVSRHRVGVVVVAAGGVLTLGFLVLTMVQVQRTQRALAVAESERSRAEQVAGFLVELFEVSDPGEARGNAVTAREILDQGAKKIATSLETQPGVRASLMDTMGAVFRNLGLYERAEALLTEALVLRRRELGREHAEVADTLTELALLTRLRGDYKQALALHREALEMRIRLLGPDHLDVAESLNNVCALENQLGQYQPARQACERSILIRERRLGSDALELTRPLESLAETFERAGTPGDAEPHIRRSLAIRQQHQGDAHLETARSKNVLAINLYRRGRLAEAEPLYRESLETMLTILDPAHPLLAGVMNNLAVVLSEKGDLAGAEELLPKVIAARRARMGDGHPEVAVGLSNLAGVKLRRGDLDAAVSLYRQALGILGTSLGEAHVNYATVLGNLAEAQYAQGDPAAARTAGDALARKLKVQPRTHQSVGASLSLVGHLQAEAGDAAGAEPVLREALDTLRKTLRDDNVRVAQAKARLGSCLLRLRRSADAEPLLREALTVLSKPQPGREARWIESRLQALPRSAAR